jgi:aryl-alcohol dehydrogenase-like predicted oxidoreductase
MVGGVAALAGGGAFLRSALEKNMSSWTADPSGPDVAGPSRSGMAYRVFGKTDLNVSEVGFGAWGIGGQAYGAVDRAESLSALARAEELGCNFVDTATVYGDSELVIGEFLKGRRSKWLVATKFSRKLVDMEAAIESSLRRLGTDVIDLYQIHWAPPEHEHELYEVLYRIKKAGKARYVGVSLTSIANISYVLKHTEIDGFMAAFSLLDPDPFLAKLDMIRRSGVGVIIRSALKEGFLTGKFKRDATFPDPNDQRHSWSREQIAQTVDAAERFRFLESDAGSMMVGAARYPLSYSETSTVVLGTKTVKHADVNFGVVPGGRLSEESLRRIQKQQKELGLFNRRERLIDAVEDVLS